MKLLSLISILFLATPALADVEEEGVAYTMRPNVVNERAIWPMPEFVVDKMEPLTIGIPTTPHKFAGCLSAEDATQIGKLHVEAGYPTAVVQFSRLMQENHCNVLDGIWFPHKVVWSGDLKESTLKVVEMSPVGPDGKPNFTLKFYVLTERQVVGSGITDKVPDSI